MKITKDDTKRSWRDRSARSHGEREQMTPSGSCAPSLLWGDSVARSDGSGATMACAVCGCIKPGCVPARDAMGTNFASHGELECQWSDAVCRACAWVLSGKPPATLRMWSVVYREDGPAPPDTSEKASKARAAKGVGPHTHLTSRADLRWAVETLLDPPPGPWIVSVATSGQKHIIPWAPVNRGGGRWMARVETVTASGDPTRLATLLCVVGEAQAAGLYTSEILSGEPNSQRLLKAGLEFWRAAEQHIRPERGGPLLGLVALALNKEHGHDIRVRATATLERRGIDDPGRRLRALRAG